MKKYEKVILEESRGMGVVETTNPQEVGREWIFLKKCYLNYMYIRHQHIKHSYYKIICFQHFPLDQEL